MIKLEPQKGTGTSLLIILNQENAKQVIGTILVYCDNGNLMFSCRSIELINLFDAQQSEKLPFGNFRGTKSYNDSYGPTLRMHNVFDNNDVLVHRGNFYYQSAKVVLVGSDLCEITPNGFLDVLQSMKSMNNLYEALNESFEIRIFKGY